MNTFYPFQRLGLILLVCLWAALPGMAQDLGEPMDPSFRIDILRENSALPYAQQPPYEWSAVHLRNAFQVDPNAPDFVLDSSYCGVGQIGSTQFDDKIRAYYQYDAQGRLAEVLFKELASGGGYENFSRKSFAYQDDVRTSYLFERWENGQWEGAYRETTVPNPEGRPATFTTEERAVGGSWMGIQRDSFVYNTGGYLAEQYQANWTGNMWLYETGQFIEYNELGAYTQVYELEANGPVWDSVMRVRTQYGQLGLNWQGYQMEEKTAQGWEPLWREMYQYDDLSFWTGMIRMSWDEQTNDWVNEVRETFEYSRKGIWLSWQQESWINTDWTPALAKRYESNATGRLDILLSWDDAQSDWQNEQRILAEYDNAQYLIREAGPQTWNGSSWENDSSSRECQHFWSEASPTNISSPVSPQQLSCIMTNPYPAYAPIGCDDLEPGHVYEIRLTDLHGRAVFQTQLKGANSFVIDRRLSTGVYQLNIFEGSTLRFSQKLLIQN